MFYDTSIYNGFYAFSLAKKLWKYNRSLTGVGVRQTLGDLKKELPNLKIKSIPSGKQVFDWTVPKEWHVREAWIKDQNGNRIIDFKDNNLHLVGYSVPFSGILSLKELETHLYSLPDQPDAIPYITSYYKRRWGFCLTHEQRSSLEKGVYEVNIDAEHFDGVLNYGELIIPGKSEKEILISTYICHPMMANNELSGPTVATALAKWVSEKKQPTLYTYRFIFVPETIGSISYIADNLDDLRKNTVAGYVLTCIGDERAYSYLESRLGNTISDKVAQHCIKHFDHNYSHYSFLARGSDERQYCSPGVDLPIASLMRTKYGVYPEYHTSLDTLGDVVTENGLQGGIELAQRCLEALEKNKVYKVTCMCEPQLGKRGLYPTLSTKESATQTRSMMHILAYSDGNHSLLDIANIIDKPIWELYPIVDSLKQNGLLVEGSE
ncbi:DUF4910 domain-containing protein [Terasakiella sp.]|uniref:DUF4910 domain-containing protein n=1 Tax=Terasakiella sp. TaxID=2034861 RepID=UPI003AA8C722